jgi:SSS family transporter
MRALDWVVLCVWLVAIVSYGLWRGRGSKTVHQYLLAGKTMPWYAMGLSIMATQAGAISFISTTGQAYVDGMRFVQFYFGLPLAMILICATAVPMFHKAGVYTAYEYLERRFDGRTRTLVSLVFLMERGLAVGVALYAPAVVLSVILGWPDRVTTVVMGSLMIVYTALGGIQAVTWADVQQMTVLVAALVLALGIAIWLLPAGVSFFDAVTLAGAAGRLSTVDTNLDWGNRYNLWSGLIGGGFLALAYFGTDQSQVQRYLTGKSIAQSRLSLVFMALTKIPMQLFLLFIGAMVFVVFTFVEPPLVFQPVALRKVQASSQYTDLERRYHASFEARRAAAGHLLRTGDSGPYRLAQGEFDGTRREAQHLAASVTGEAGFNDTNYIFLSFVTHYLPMGVVGLIIGVIFSAGMSSISGEINSLATVTVVDVYRRIYQRGTDRHYLLASRVATCFWGIYAIAFASRGAGFGALIETVNIVGSLFYGSMLGVFVLAFGFPKVGARGAFYGMILGEVAILTIAYFTPISYLWYNVVGCLVTVAAGLLITVRKPL